MLLRIFTCAMLVFSATTGFSQQNTSAAGGNYSGTGGTVSFTVGQVDYITTSGTSGNLNQGVQQPYEIFQVSTLDELSLHLDIKVGPIPSSEEISIIISDLTSQKLHYELVDANGKLLRSSGIDSKNTLLPISSFSAGNYFLNILDDQGATKTFKIIKNL